MLLLLDNYDSFTYNLVHAFQVLGEEVVVLRNDAVTVQECLGMEPDYIVIGPGPGGPKQAGISLPLISAAAGNIPLLGVCLGMQAIGELYGGVVKPSGAPVHGKVSRIHHTNAGLFAGLPSPFLATRYHSLIVDGEYLPACLEATALSDEGHIMGLRHRSYLVEGVQFHPESHLTTSGLDLFKNFLEYIVF